jgi:hypothetical protein
LPVLPQFLVPYWPNLTAKQLGTTLKLEDFVENEPETARKGMTP